MSWFEALRPKLLAPMVIGMTLALGGCSFSPVYSGTLAQQSALDLAYAEPNNRLEQIIYQDLALRLGRSSAETAPLATVTASAAAADMMVTGTTNPAKPVEVTVTATLTVIARDDSERTPVSFTRRATANYTRSGQVLADSVAAEEAAERAAKSAAESLRLAVLAALSR